MIPDEKKPVPWGLPPLRAEVQKRRQAESSAHSQGRSTCPAEVSSQDTKLDMDDYYEQAESKGYTLLQPQRRPDVMTLRRRMIVFLAGMVLMVGAVLYIRYVMYDPRVIDPSTFSATTLGTSPDTLEAVDRLLRAGLDQSNTIAWDRLAEMTDMYGHRMTGSKAYDHSAEWVVKTANAQDTNLTAYTEPVWVNQWTRGSESLRLFAPTRDMGFIQLPLLGLGNSVGTPRDGIEANVIPVHSFDELHELGNANIAGNIVLYNFHYSTYDAVVRFRTRGAAEAAKYGALAVLVRSITPDSEFHSIHTGSSTRTTIPAAAISPADANMIERMHERAQTSDHLPPRVKLVMNARLTENAKQSANVIIDLKGSTAPEEIVLLSGHFDSWDIGVGAMDDGAGAFLAWEAARLIALSGRPPRRTIRVVMWNNEETLQRGAKAYFKQHEHEIGNHKFAMESDIGVFEPWGLTVKADPVMVSTLRNYGADLIKILGAGNITSPDVEGPGQDIAILCENGVPCAGFLSVNPENGAVPGGPHWEDHYFRYHHTSNDRMEAIDKHQLRRSAAALAAWAYLIADL
ncbi:hypothetical protein IWW37_002529 [Coemansia sp. RSA 2050]|nr:hypothetical protein IWW37_002529 [Coemansia sp. RSA 2050]KAJ2734111.1 hypothetical protein IW152_002553 [Coemansia sp. BCRC 34962]